MTSKLNSKSENDVSDKNMSISFPFKYESIGELKNSQLSSEDIEDKYTVEQAIEMLGFGMFQIKLSLLTGLAWMSDAMEMMILSILSPALHCSWGLLAWQRALITTAVFVGMMMSSTFWGKICDRFGRKTALLMCSLFTFYFGFLSSFSPTFLWLILLRGLTGFGIGGAPQSITLYSEFLPSKYRAKCLILIEIFWGLGTCFEVLLALIIMPTLGWPWLLAFSSLPLLLFSCFSLWLPESARYHVACKDFKSAYKVIERIAKENKRPLPIGTLVGDDDVVDQNPTENPSTFSDTTNLLDNHRGRFKDLFATDIRRTTFLLWIIWMVNAFSYYGIVLMTTELFESGDKCHGGSGKQLSQPSCLLDCHPLQRSDYVDLLWTTLAEFPGLFLTVFIIESLGRKITIAIEFFAFSIFVFLLNICSNSYIRRFSGYLCVHSGSISHDYKGIGHRYLQHDGSCRCYSYSFCSSGVIKNFCEICNRYLCRFEHYRWYMFPSFTHRN
ncbi:synaptic vesicle 2-related protein-like isoform X2 [Gordionus sp. m RMFG-2023]|uniref:synaptic vesicle 2-related protein-like isoform X2 n=1 Tax=Gordionus sp. m RMFG-2023 TaxID=3053472 RepID=UPI0031FC670C